MIVCLCHRVSDRDIRAAVDDGAHDFETVQDITGAATQCGCCRDCAREVFDEALQTAACTPRGGKIITFAPRQRALG